AVPVARPSSAAIPVACPSSASNPAVRPPPPAARPPPPTPAPRPPPVFDIDPNDSAPTVGSGFANERTFVGANQAQAAFADDGGTLPGTIPPIAGGNVPRPAPPVFSDATLPPTAPSQRPVVTPVGQRPTMAAPAVRAAPPPRVPAGPPPIDLAPPSLRAHAAPPPADVVAAPSRKKLVALAGIGLGVLVLGGVAAVSLMGGSGTLFVAYEPKDATVVVDGVELCSASPCFDSKLAAGPHQLEIRKEGYQPFSRLVEIPRGDIFRIPEVSLRALETKVSTIIATVPAEAEVRIDGKVVKEQGRTDFYSTEFVAGRPYEVKVSMAGYQTWTQTVTVSADEKLHKEFAQLARAEAQIKLTSSPEGATVIIDQRERGVTPLVATDLDPARPHTVVFRKSCYEDATATIMPGGAADIRKDLVKKPKCP
ncbi:MAG: PEGA domain-containing protein, partial [Myxococcales bacterium]